MSIDDLVNQIRAHINDYKFAPTAVVDEVPGEGKNSPHVSYNKWNSFSTGVNHEAFLTKHMPLVSGGKVVLKGGRWTYDNGGEYPNSYAGSSAYTNKKIFLIDYYRGMFIVPSGATPVPSGEKVLLTYPWWEDKEYRFSDDEVRSWIADGDSYIRQRISVPWTILGLGAGLSLDPVPSGIYFSLLALSTSYFMRRRLQEEGVQDGIFIKDGDTTFDTTRTLVHRGRQLEEVKKDIDAILLDIKMGELASAGARIDSYSTYDYNDVSAYSFETNIAGIDPLIGG